MRVLNINSSSNRGESISEQYGRQLIDQLKLSHTDLTIIERHTTYSDLPFVTKEMLAVFFSKGPLTEDQKLLVETSRQLVEELKAADVLVITAPIYNFSIPASLKAYFDLVARAGETFKYTESGPEGLLGGKKAYVVVSSGGTEINSDIDFAGRYIEHFLTFLGITDIEFLKLDQLLFKAEEKKQEVTLQIEAMA